MLEKNVVASSPFEAMSFHHEPWYKNHIGEGNAAKIQLNYNTKKYHRFWDRQARRRNSVVSLTTVLGNHQSNLMVYSIVSVAVLVLISWSATAFRGVARNLITSSKKISPKQRESRIGSTLVDAPSVVLAGFDYKTSNKLPWSETGYSSW